MGAIHSTNFTENLYANIGWRWKLRDRDMGKYSDDQTEREYSIYNLQNKRVVVFRARALPGCCGVLVVYYLRPSEIGSAMGTFKKTLKLIMKAASKAHFGLVMLTQTVDSTGDTILKAMSTPVTWTNWKTKNNINTYQLTTEKPKDLEDDDEETFDGE